MEKKEEREKRCERSILEEKRRPAVVAIFVQLREYRSSSLGDTLTDSPK